MRSELLEMFTSSWGRRLESAVFVAIDKSFETHPMQNTTNAEVHRRTDICVKLIKRLRSDLRWSAPRIIDNLSVFLRYELDGADYDDLVRALRPPAPIVPGNVS